MNTFALHPPRLPSTPQEGNLLNSQNSQIESIQRNIKKIVWNLGGAVEEIERRKEEFLRIEEIALAFEESGYDSLIHFGSLIRQSGDVNKKDQYGEPAITLVAWIGRTEIIKLLLTHQDIQVNEKNSSRDTALMSASRNGHIDITALFLARPDILVNEKDKNENTALISAVWWGYIEIIELLLTHPDIQLNVKNSNGYTALMRAVKDDYYKDVITLLLADPRLKLEIHDQWKKALEVAETPEIKALIEEAMSKQGIQF
jgi:ankyrin repeat protein